MSGAMRPIPFKKLLDWILEENRKFHSIFGLPREKFYRAQPGVYWQLFGEYLENVIGPAAGPHTQLAQNIVAAYLAGGRFFELKTVQVLDRLDIPKPCINAADEGYNVEWSTELAIEEAFEEYVKAWFLLHVLQKELWGTDRRGFMFNMSVGYDLKGIKSPKVDRFIESLKDASSTAIFQECRAVLQAEVDRFTAVDAEFIDGISPHICSSVTLSTMHGCPPAEIETICRYLLAEKRLHTFVKLNPTLLGYKFVKDTLAGMGYSYIQLKEESFSHDLQYTDGVALIGRLQEFAREQGRGFGVKLSNTLPVQVTRGELPGEEMYLSGRALYPLTLNLAARLAQEFNGHLRISYAGGGDAFNLPRLFATGIWPLTVATTLLKPGGYLRLQQIAAELATRMPDTAGEVIDVAQLAGLAAGVTRDPDFRKEKRGVASRKLTRKLPLTDCFLAPCTAGCPIGQDIPEYIRLVGEKRYREAYELIIEKNPLPFITGSICTQHCAAKCTRLDYDEPVRIREMKKAAAVKGYRASRPRCGPAQGKASARVAVIGAGPAGLAAGYFLARAGLGVTIFDKKEKPGGTVTHVIPDFRLSEDAIARDLELVKGTGVEFKLGVSPDFNVAELKRAGYKYVFLAPGAGASRPLELRTGGERVMGAVEFLAKFKEDRQKVRLGKRVAVIGGGNTAMDAARAALRVPGVEKVTIIYRRTREYMPASREELREALAEGVVLKELLAPYSWSEGVLRCQQMELEAPDASGRPGVAVKAGEFVDIPADAVLAAIGQDVDYGLLEKNGIAIDEGVRIVVDPATNETSVANVFIGGDALRGPATIVEAIADGRKAARAILTREGLTPPVPGAVPFDREWRLREVNKKKGNLAGAAGDPGLEPQRCLECGFVCNICTEVCPNRANIAIQTRNGGFRDQNQIVHVDGMCNECGNCATFCPYDGAPYRDKLTLFWKEEDFAGSQNNGFLLLAGGAEPVFKVRLNGRVQEVKFDPAGKANVDLEQGVLDLILAVYKGYRYLF
ncbi:putative selenate reductase subunit YgfK [Neomoorella thermoacetica]|uniref:putative selenate reductase subunit YgfK n=1 Tax=Neomoorella thermoacetica TaxID=1525 RepID=UPI0008FB4977|nr:putative selenate reductase subunit YgfK [Moorella thermoacetica]OIQ62709.1 glutamate synthase [NADPH] small chain [Moorella thermoacetica]